MPESPQNERPRVPTRRATSKVMKRARTVQLSMLPKTPSIEGLDLFAHYAPCEAVGGDFYDFVPVSPWEIGIVMGDVSGHGVDAALTMAVAKKTIQIHGMGRSSPRETLLVTCADLAPDLPGNSFVTVFYGVLDLRNWKLTFASAGHTPPIIFNPDRKPPLQSVPAKGVVMGAAFVQAMEKILTEQTIELRKGDTLFLYTDGLSEAPNVHDEQFGEPRVLRALDRAGTACARDLVTAVAHELTQFIGDHPPQDDLTMLAVHIAGDPKAGARAPQNQRRRVWPTNLRPAKSTFLGRAEELAQLQKWLHDEGSLVTITGISGLGKSRLALEAGRALLEHLPGGVWLVDASGSRDVEQTALAVARTLGVALTSVGSALEAISATLEFRPPLLLILDNCEAGERFVRPLLEHIRRAAPRVRLLITGREAMGISGERELELKPLDTPKKNDLASSAAASLFVARARESNPGFSVNDDSAPRIAAIVRELGGNPLAIELAAAQSAGLTPSQIDDGLRRDRETRRPSQKVTPDSHPVVAPDAAEWAYEQLLPVEKLAFCQLSLMRGGFYLEAAEAIVKVPEDTAAGDVTVIVQSLLDKQLLQTEDTPYGVRFLLLPPIRSFGRRKRAESFSAEQEDALTGRFVRFYSDYAMAQEARFASRGTPEVVDRLEIDLDNIFGAQDFALAMNRPDLAARALVGLSPLFDLRSPMMPRVERLNRTLNALDKKDVVTRARLHMVLANAMFYANKWEDTLRHLAMATSLSQTGGNNMIASDALAFGAFVHVRHSEFKAARESLDLAIAAAKASYARGHERALVYSGILTSQERGSAEALPIYEGAESLIRAREDLPMLIECLNCKASALRAVHRLPEALACSQEVVKLLLKLNAPLGVAVQTNNIGMIHRAMDRFDDALEYYLQAEASLREIGERLVLPRVLCNIADIYQFLDKGKDAARYAREALELASKDNDKQMLLRVHHVFGQIALAQRQYAGALACFEKALILARELGRPADISTALGFASLCRMEIGAAEQALADITTLQAQAHTLSEHKSALTFFLAACRAKAEFKLGRRKQASTALTSAQALAKQEKLDHYSSDLLLHAAWGVIDELIAAALGDPKAERVALVRCKSCRVKVRGTRKQIDDLAACPACKATPFRHVAAD